jgi:glycerophosphoryl diester phosphodiesterase
MVHAWVRHTRRHAGPAIAVLLPVAAATLLAAQTTGPRDRASVRLHVLDIRSARDLRQFFRYDPDGPPLVTTHRGGARAGFPENAIETFENTLRHTWSSLEVDPRYTSDGVAVLFHDDTLERTSTGKGLVRDQSYEELRRLRLKDPNGNVTECRIPTLDTALEWAKGKTVLFLDNKDVDVVERARRIQANDARAWAVVMAYSFDDARRVHDFDPEIMVQVFLPDAAAVVRFDKIGLPWENVIGFVTHTKPADPDVFRLIGQRGAMAIVGTSRSIDRAYTSGVIGRDEMGARYRATIRTGAHVVEADLGIEAGEALEPQRAAASAKRGYFRISDVPKFRCLTETGACASLR